jgi:ABC-type sugar transport system ATPase subunit
VPTVQGIPVVQPAFGAIRVPAETATTLLSAAGDERQLVCGIRPEDVALSSSPVASDAAPHATVNLIELVGADRYLSLTRGDLLLQARVPADQEWHEGQRVALTNSVASCSPFGLFSNCLDGSRLGDSRVPPCSVEIAPGLLR